MARDWFRRRRADDFAVAPRPDIIAEERANLLARIAAIPLDLLPSRVARERLIVEAKSGGPLIDVYKGGGGYRPDFHSPSTGEVWVIERPLSGRHDSRWPCPEWAIWCDAGMMVQTCMTCGEGPVTFALADVYRYSNGGRVYICYDCNAAHLGLYGYSQHAILDPCPICHQVGITVDPESPARCILCYRNGRKA